MFKRFFLFVILVMITHAAHADDPVSQFMTAFTESAKLVEEFASTCYNALKTLTQSRKALGKRNFDIAELKKINTDLEEELSNLSKSIEKFGEHPVKKSIDTLNTQCSGPLIATMVVPNVGPAISALCAKIGALSLKIDAKIIHAQNIVMDANNAKNHINEKIEKISALSQVDKESIRQAAQNTVKAASTDDASTDTDRIKNFLKAKVNDKATQASKSVEAKAINQVAQITMSDDESAKDENDEEVQKPAVSDDENADTDHTEAKKSAKAKGHDKTKKASKKGKSKP